MSQDRVALQKGELWQLLVETVHTLPMYKYHKRYVEQVMLKDKPGISAKELAVQINVPLGEAVVLLDELHGSKSPSVEPDAASSRVKSADRSLFDFNG